MCSNSKGKLLSGQKSDTIITTKEKKERERNNMTLLSRAIVATQSDKLNAGFEIYGRKCAICDRFEDICS